jgi:L-alanine-DL-glutamate epimerase-like enolase superfamily enzyme
VTGTISIARIQAFAFRSPIAIPVETSFGIMRNRPATFVRIEDQDGAFGWGEIFCNWPAAAAEHRVNLLAQDIAPLVFDRLVSRPSELFEFLTARTHIPALQSGEWGPFRQVIAGLDIALWDLFARKNGQTLRHFINHGAVDEVPAYASGIHIKDASALIQSARDIGFQAFKVKVGFEMQDDLKRLNDVFEAKSATDTIAADANQGWDLAAAMDFMEQARSFPLVWLEEPIEADAAQADWEAIAKVSPFPLAGGENLVGFVEFETAINAAHLRIFQPDIIKWGGLTGCLSVGRSAIAAGLRYCPHFLGGGIGLQASANLLAAVGGDGLLEVDVNPNPLRDGFSPIDTRISDGLWHLNEEPGIGITALPEVFDAFLSHSAEMSTSD